MDLFKNYGGRRSPHSPYLDPSHARPLVKSWAHSFLYAHVLNLRICIFRYANRQGLAAIELMNEPLAPGVTLDDLSNYYRAGYNAVRKYTSSAYVILSNRLGNASNTELLPLAGGLSLSVIDVHYYNLYWDYFSTLNTQQNIDYINNERADSLQQVTQTNGPLSFVGKLVLSCLQWISLTAILLHY